MKTLIGVDLGGRYEPALQLAMDLDFPDQHMLFLNSVEPIPEYAPPMHETTLNTSKWMEHLREAGRQAVKRAEATSCAKGVPSHALVVDGSAAANLMILADREQVDLIGVGTGRRSIASGFLFGSVARGLAIGAKQSILVTKEEELRRPPLRALFATDHSEYANRCLEKLLQWAPKGILYIDVVTAYEVNDEAATMLHKNLPSLGTEVERLIEEHLEKKTTEVASTLVQAGYLSRSYVRKGHPNEVLKAVMEESGAALMIVGAQGHGLLDRLLIGSVSLHQVVAEPYAVLLLRA